MDLVPAPEEYPVRAGQVIALSGNTGYSFGPHLHLDMYETETEEYVDPLPFFRQYVKDHRPPSARGVMFFPQPGRGMVEGSSGLKSFPASLSRPVEAWGVIGVGISAYDYMEGTANRYGVHTVVLEVDGTEVFRSVVDRFAYHENRYINSWTHGAYMKSFIEPGNRLRMLHANDDRGLVAIDEERLYHFTYTLRDAFGNTSSVRFAVQGKKRDIPPVECRSKYRFRWDRTNYLQEPGLELVVPKGMLYDDVSLNYEVRSDSGDIACTYQLNDVRTPLHDACDIRIGLRNDVLADKSKYYVASVDAHGRHRFVGGIYEAGFMKASVRELGTYTVAVDTVPPSLVPVSQSEWRRTGRVVFKARDNESGIDSYRGTIDGKYALFGKPNAIQGHLVCVLDAAHVEKGKKHVVELTVCDACGNQTTVQQHFVW